jgi:hypothetical protein
MGSSSSSWESVSERSDLGEPIEDHRRMAKLTGEGFMARLKKARGRRVAWTPSVSPEGLTSGFGPSESWGVIKWRESSVVELEGGFGPRRMVGVGNQFIRKSESGTTGTHFRRARFMGFGARLRSRCSPLSQTHAFLKAKGVGTETRESLTPPQLPQNKTVSLKHALRSSGASGMRCLRRSYSLGSTTGIRNGVLADRGGMRFCHLRLFHLLPNLGPFVRPLSTRFLWRLRSRLLLWLLRF